MDVDIKFKGLTELDAKLGALSQELAVKSIVSAAYSANKAVVDAAQAQIDAEGLVDTGLLRSAITRKKLIYAKNGRVVIITGVNKNVRGVDRNGKPRIPWRYANALSPKYRFMQQAMDGVKTELVNKFVDVCMRRVKKHFKNGGK